MQSLAESFLTPDEQQRVTEYVQRAERRTSGEIVPMIVSTSYDYPMAVVRGATFISLPLALLVTQLISAYLWLQIDKMWLFLGCFTTLYLAAWFLVGNVPALKRRFLAPARIDEEVKEAATTSFFTEGLYRTRAENGIILFISVFEHRVWILGDRGINEKIAPDYWQQIVDQVTIGIKGGRQCEAICTAIEAIGDILAEHFPIESDDKDELHNLIIR